MFSKNMPLKDEISWGKGSRFEIEYINYCLEQADETFQQGLFIAKQVPLSDSYSKAIDLGCGIGTQICAISEFIQNAQGVDISPLALKYAHEISKLKNSSASFINENILSPETITESSLITCLNNTFGLLSDYESETLLSSIFTNLRSKGTLVLSFDNREQIVEKMSFHIGSGKKWKEENGIVSCKTEFFDLLNGRYNLKEEFMDIKTGEKTTEPYSSVRLYALSELNLMLENNGFEIESVFGDYDGSEYSVISPYMIVFAKKP